MLITLMATSRAVLDTLDRSHTESRPFYFQGELERRPSECHRPRHLPYCSDHGSLSSSSQRADAHLCGDCHLGIHPSLYTGEAVRVGVREAAEEGGPEGEGRAHHRRFLRHRRG